MDVNALVDHVCVAQGDLWIEKLYKICQTGRLCTWVSLFHPQQLECKIEHRLNSKFYNGSFNLGTKVVFSDSTAWMVRFPRVGTICDDYADEKVAMEVSALNLIHDRTTIPVPRVYAWGVAASNQLGLGPFIMMDFVSGVSLNILFYSKTGFRIIREDISGIDLELVYRQSANILLQFFELDFDWMGSLPSPARGDRSQGFKTTTEYFQYLVKQDWEQLLHQPNSICGPYDARNKYLAFKALHALIPDFVNAKYDRGNFKLICDVLGLGNLIVRSKDDLTVVGVIDLEWSYIGPAQLFGSPWWLLGDRPVNPDWDFEGDKPPKITARYFKCLEIFIRILEEEEANMPGHAERELTSLVKWSQASGAMWLHILLSAGFNDTESFPFMHLCQHIGKSEWVKRQNEFENVEEIDAFAALKVKELEEYDAALDKLEEEKALVDCGKMTKEEFVANNLVDRPLLSSHMVNDEALKKSEEKAPVDGGRIAKEEPVAIKLVDRPSSSSYMVNKEMTNNEGIFEKVTAWLYLRAAELRVGATIARDNWYRPWMRKS